MSWFLDAGLVSGGVGLVSGWFVPSVVARLPEPKPDPEPDDGSDGASGAGVLEPAENEADFARPVDEPKELYAELARLPGLRWKLAATCALAAGLLGARLGWTPALLFVLYLVPVCVALALVDWRTRYLPTRLIAPSYLVVAVLVVVASVVDSDWEALRGSAIGWVGSFAFFFVMWFLSPRSMAYGDVRLAGLLGMAVGWVGLAQLVLAMTTSFLLLAIGGIVLSLTRVFHRRHMPFGPFLVVGAFLGLTFPLALLAVYEGVVGTISAAILAVVGGS